MTEVGGFTGLRQIRAESKAREAEEREGQERKRAVLVLVQRFLSDQGYIEAYQRLATESGVSLEKVDIADNMDLLTIVQQFEEFYEFKYRRRPKLTRKAAADPLKDAGTAAALELLSKPVSGAAKARLRREKGAAAQAAAREKGRPGAPGGLAAAREKENAKAKANGATPGGRAGADPGPVSVDGLGMTPVLKPGGEVELRPRAAEDAAHEASADFFEHRLLKPLPDLGSDELRELGATITRDIYVENPEVYWDSIAGQAHAKRLLQEAVVLPNKYPQLFTGLLQPWRGVLLYGPPGTGKTMLAKAVATECRTTFFYISASSVISKWRGDSEKLIRVLFELARYHAPSTIFLDEIDALMTARGGGGEHEASRRMKTELLVQMDGLAKSEKPVFVLAATNLPWELDMALLRRLEKRILVPLPDRTTRAELLAKKFAGYAVDMDAADIAANTADFSGSDIALLCKECAMRPMRRLIKTLDLQAPADQSTLALGAITREDVEGALASTKPSSRMYEEKYRQFSELYGDQG